MKFILSAVIIFFASVACNSSNKLKKAGTPDCIVAMINQFKQDSVANPPRSVTEFTFRGRTVYYVPPICCDQMSALYDSACNLIGAPDGGYTGKGDGKLTGFRDSVSNERLIWKDER